MKNLCIKCFFYVLAIVGVLLAETLIDTTFIEGYTFYLRPFVWIVIAVVGYCFIAKPQTIKNKSDKFLYVLTFSIIFVTSYYLLGVVLGFARSPYARTFLGIVRNLFAFITPIVCYEIIRYVMVSSTISKIQNVLNFLLMFVLYMGIDNIMAVVWEGISYAYLLGTILPCIIQQCFLFYLCKHCGLASVLVWKLPTSILLYLLPIVPNLNWFFQLFYTSLSCLICYVFLYYTFVNTKAIKDVRVKRKKKPIMGLFLMLLILGMAGFVSGMYPQVPVVIVSNSMNPYFYRGDIVVINKNGEYEEGSVIQFHMNGMSVVHRIYEKNTTPQGINYYTTKGDNNNAVDDWIVYEDQIDGVLSCVIPKIGYVTIWINEMLGRG